jgi:hypothetical protein
MNTSMPFGESSGFGFLDIHVFRQAIHMDPPWK